MAGHGKSVGEAAANVVRPRLIGDDPLMCAPRVSAYPPMTFLSAVRSSFGEMSASALLLLIVIANFALQPLTEPDFGWHLRTGLDVLHHGLRLPDLDPYSHTMPDWAWVEHAWLTDVLMAGVYSLFGALGVIVFFAAVTISAWLIGASVASVSLTFRWLSCAISLWVALPYLGARTQFVTLLGVALLLWMLKRWQNGNDSIRWWIPPLFMIWSNLHGGFVVGLLILGLVIGTTAILKWLSDRRLLVLGRCEDQLFSREDLKRLVVLALVSAGLTLVNPYGFRLHIEILTSLSNQFMLETLQEWQPLSVTGIAGHRYALFLAGMAVGMALWYRKVEPVRWVVGLVFLAFSVRHMRNIPFFLIVSLPLCAELLAGGYERLFQRFPLRETAVKKGRLAAAALIAVVLWWLGSEHVERIALSGTSTAEFFRTTHYPIEAIEWIRAHRDEAGERLYNDYGDGGFLLWWLPGTKIFIDGRMPAWQSGDRDILRDYLALNGAEPDLRVLIKYSVDWALVRRRTSLENVLAGNAAWSRVYADDKAAIYRLNAMRRAF